MSCKDEPKDESDLVNRNEEVHKLHLINDGQGWIVGIYDTDNLFVKLLPHGEPKPYTTEKTAREAALLLQEIDPQYKLD